MSIVKKIANRIKRELAPPDYIYAGTDWAEAEAKMKPRGWNEASVLQTYRTGWPGFIQRLEGELPGEAHFMVALWAFDLALQGRKEVSVLDWGGGLGSYLALFQKLRPNVGIHYTCKDLPILAAEGAKLWPESRFITDESELEDGYDFILLSSSLQYSTDWEGVLGRLVPRVKGGLLLSRCPITDAPTHLVIQNAYRTQFLGWVLNKQQLLSSPVWETLTLDFAIILEGTLTQPKQAPTPSAEGFLFYEVGRGVVLAGFSALCFTPIIPSINDGRFRYGQFHLHFDFTRKSFLLA